MPKATSQPNAPQPQVSLILTLLAHNRDFVENVFLYRQNLLNVLEVGRSNEDCGPSSAPIKLSNIKIIVAFVKQMEVCKSVLN